MATSKVIVLCCLSLALGMAGMNLLYLRAVLHELRREKRKREKHGGDLDGYDD